MYFFFLRFTQNLSLFRRDINETLKGLNTAPDPISDILIFS